MIRHPLDMDGLHERASATPDGPDEGVSPRRSSGTLGHAHAVASDRLDDETLRGRQRWFARAVMTPESDETAVSESDAAHVLTAGPQLTALERLEIYRRGYHARLIECLADDYPSLQHALGLQVFDELCRLYIERHPSESPNLNFFGKHMAALCGAEPLHRDCPRASQVPRPFCADLATLEWAIVEVIHAPSSPPLTLDGLQHISPDRWAEARLVGNTALRLLRFDYPVNEYFQAVREGASPPIPEPQESTTVVYRSGPTIWRMDLTTPMFHVLSALLAGEALEAALGRAETSLAHLDEQQTVERVMTWFREWVSSGLFVRVEMGLAQTATAPEGQP